MHISIISLLELYSVKGYLLMILNKKLNIHQYAIHCYAVVL